MSTIRYALPFIADSQAQKHITHNEALDQIDAALTGLAVSASRPQAPIDPVEGEVHIVADGATGFGTATAGDIAVWSGGQWTSFAPGFGMSLRVLDAGVSLIFAGSAGWRVGSVLGALTGASLGLSVRDAVLELTGPTTTASGLIPARAIVVGVTAWVIDAVTGATGFDLGDGTTPDRFGGSLGVTAGASNIGVVGPFATYAPQDVVATALGSDFTGGQIGVAALLIEPGEAPI